VAGPRTLLVYAHPAIERAQLNPTMLQAAQGLPGLTAHDLYEVYPDFTIDVPAEQRLLVDHDLIVLQFPLYWYSAPALLKEWLDLVWRHGFAFGRDGGRLAGKTFTCSVTAGEARESYTPDGRNRRAIEEYLRPFEQTARYCGLRWAEPFVVYRAETATPEALAAAGRRYRDHLLGLAAGAARSTAA
jgi:glutathione-regulated potassium-efflux system ancillary protein KefG